MVLNIDLQKSEPPSTFSESSLIILTKSRLNLTPEKLHSEGRANRLHASTAMEAEQSGGKFFKEK